jgi:hypothetical protein
MAKACGIAALLILGASTMFHFATYIPAIPLSMEMAWPLHLATMAVFAAMVFSLVAQQRREPMEPAKGLFARWRAASQRNKEFQSNLVRLVPFPLFVACGAAFVYAVINFALFTALMEGGSPTVKNGNYYLHSHGKKIRDITKEEYQRFRAYEVRGFSGHWIVFSIVPMAYFLTVHPKLNQTTESSSEKADEFWGAHIYVMLGLKCDDCGAHLDCEHCWDDAPPGEDGAKQFADRAVRLAKNVGWSLQYDPLTPRFFCPDCTAKRKGA